MLKVSIVASYEILKGLQMNNNDPEVLSFPSKPIPNPIYL